MRQPRQISSVNFMKQTEIIRQLRPVIESALVQAEPHCGLGTGSGLIFTGNYDWHSSVHAHWALLSMARAGADNELRDTILARLSPHNLAAEHEFLARDTQFELPYGRAWLALLLSELEKHPHNYAELPQLRALIETQVIEWLEQTPFEANAPRATGANIACGSHQSWLFAYLLLQLSAPLTPIQARLNDLFPRIEAARLRIARTRPSDYDFLYLPAVLQAIEATRSIAATAAPYRHSTRPKWQTLDRANCHTAGANVTRLWPRAFEGQFSRALNDVFKRREQWAGDFLYVSHWVPQFIWLGALLERGEFAARSPEREKTILA